MSLSLIETEIRRFLSSPTPEVLCISGQWGVGKTYGWKKFLDEARRESKIAITNYSYVSLFGLNSLDDLRFAIFENTVSGENVGASPDETTFAKLFETGSNIVRRLKPVADWAAAIGNRKGVSDLLFKSAFLSVRQQIICLDDLERAGKGLEVRDVLGLASLLKEERQCKVVMLLNEQEHPDRKEFKRQLEKVADTTLVFDLTSAEAVSIALIGTDRATQLLRPRIVDLGIINIRVIKKIERLADRLVSILDGLDDAVIEKAVATLTLASWSVQQPDTAPTLGFLRRYNRFAGARSEHVDINDERYRSMIKGYPFPGPEALDQLIMDGAEAGYFKDTDVRAEAEALQLRWRQRSRDSAFTSAWEELYHGSLATNDDDFLDALFASARAEAAAISPLNINGAIRMLREYGRAEQADELTAEYIAAHGSEDLDFFDISQQHFLRKEEIDNGLREAFAAKWREIIDSDSRDPLAVLTAIGERRGWENADIALMAAQSVDDFERMFEAIRGELLYPAIETILHMGNGQREASVAIREASRTALRRIAAKSRMRAQKISRLGIDLEEDNQVAQGEVV